MEMESNEIKCLVFMRNPSHTEDFEAKSIKLHRERKKYFKCDHCDYSTTLKSTLAMHAKVVHKTKHYKCDKCPFVTTQRDQLYLHNKRIHEDFKCLKCDYASSYKLNLAIHMRTIHETSTSQNLHIKSTHDKIGDIKCEQCEFSTFQRGNLVVHMKCAHDKNRYHKCMECDYAASQKKALANHMERAHHTLQDLAGIASWTKCWKEGSFDEEKAEAQVGNDMEEAIIITA